MSQQYVATAKKATAVSKSLVCHFTGADDLNLVIAKGARLEIRDITPEGLQHRLDVPLYGAIATMEAYRLPEESSDRLFILTERYQFCVLQYDGARQVRKIKLRVRHPRAVQHARGHLSRQYGRGMSSWLPELCLFSALDECLRPCKSDDAHSEDAGKLKIRRTSCPTPHPHGEFEFALARSALVGLTAPVSLVL